MREPLTYKDYDKVKHRRGFYWFYFCDWDFYIMAPPKVASTTLKQFVWMHEIEESVHLLKQHQVPKTDNVYVIVRHPLDRFRSLWRSKCNDGYPSDRTVKAQIFGKTPTELMDYIESGAPNVHSTPQHRMLGDHKPTLIPLEMLGYWWKQSGYGEIGKYNTTEGEVDIDDELRERILTFYADDVTLYHKAQCDFCWDTLRK